MHWKELPDFIKTFFESENIDIFDAENEKNSQNAAEESSTTFSELTDVQLNNLWRKLYDLSQTHMGNVLSNNSEEVATGAKAVRAIVQLAKLTLKEKPQYASPQFLNTVTYLNDWLQHVPNDMDNIKNEISQLCEEWLAMNKERKELIVTRTVLYVLQRILQPNAPISSLQRMWNIRQSITLALEERTNDSTLVFASIEKCFSSKLFLTNKLGRKLLAFFLSLDANRIEALHYTVKSCLLNCSANGAETYGNIYFSVWQDSTGSFKQNFEEKCLQDLLFFAIHLPPTESKLFANIRKVLNAFNAKKFQESVSSVILRVYDPIIWRSLKVANTLVRKNAAVLVFDTFPVEEPNSTLEVAQQTMISQGQAMKNLLEDDFHSVRAIAAYGICSVLRNYWEIFPSELTPQILDYLCNDLMFDSSSVEVRTSVLKGLTVLLENHLSYSILKVLLPKISVAFHDVSDNVRLEFCTLLLKIKVIPNIQFWKVVPMDHLLARLEEDEFNICEKIFNLISNSFFSKSYSDEERVYKCCHLIDMNRSASRVFFHQLSKSGDIQILVSYIVALAKILHKSCKKGIELRGNATDCINDDSDDDSESIQNKENVDSSEQSSALETEKENGYLSNPNIVCSLLDSVCILWWGINSNRKQELKKDQIKAITAAFTPAASFISKLFKQSVPVQQSLIYLCSCVKVPSAYMNLNSKILSLLKALPNEAISEQYINILGSALHRNQIVDLMALIRSWISTGLNASPIGKKKQKKGVVIVDPVSPKPLLAIHLLQDLLLLHDARAILLDKHCQILQDILLLLPFLKENIYNECKPITDSSKTVNSNGGNVFLVDTFSTFCQLALLLHEMEPSGEEDEKIDNILKIIDVVFWLQNELLPLWIELSSVSSEELSAEDSQRKEFLRKVFEILLKTASDMYLISLCSNSFNSVLENFLCTLLQSGIQEINFSLVGGLLTNIVGYAMTTKATAAEGAETPQVDNMISNLVSKLLQVLSQNIRIDSIIGQRNVALVKPQLARILTTMLKWLGSKDLRLHDVVATMMAASVAEVTKIIERYQTFDLCDEIADLPPVTSAVLSIHASRATFLRIFLNELLECLTAGVIKEMSGCLALVHIVRTLIVDRHTNINRQHYDFQKVKNGLQSLYDKLKINSHSEDQDLDSSFSGNKLSELVVVALGEIHDKLG